MRLLYDARTSVEDRRRLASTIFFFLLAVNGVLLLACCSRHRCCRRGCSATAATPLALQLVLLNTFAIGFTFIPFHVLRMENRAREFSAIAFARSLSTLLLRIVLVVGAGYGIMGVVWADMIVTVTLMLVMVRWFAPLLRPLFSKQMLKDVLAFGLPRVPHGLAQQVMSVGDRFILKLLNTPLDAIGVYSIGVSFGLIPKLALLSVRVRVGAVLLRDGAGARCAAGLQRRDDLRRRGTGVVHGRLVGDRT